MTTYAIRYHKEIVTDLSHIPGHIAKDIVRKIFALLATYPTEVGKPLRQSLRGLFEIKAGRYRVVYEVLRKEVAVYVIVIGHRRNAEVFETARKRR